MNNNWITFGNSYSLKEVSQQLPKLPAAIYRACENPLTKEIYLTQVQSRFNFEYKVYGIESPLISRIVTTYKHTTGNLGVLLNGTKGTGKTVTARILCNELQLPVLIVPEPFENIPAFLHEIQQEVVVFIDEYEKIYSDYDDRKLLTVMDGVMNSEHRRVFLLTTNQLHVNDNLLQRPGRIRYVKTFKDLPLETIIEIVDDLLTHPEYRNETIEYIASLESITVDIVKSVVEEVNIHNEPPVAFADVFNTKQNGDKHDVYEIAYGDEAKLLFGEAICRPLPIRPHDEERSFYVNGERIGEIVKVHSEGLFTISLKVGTSDGSPETTAVKTLRLDPVKALHREFWKYAF